jgi:hypothetical protein
MHQVVTGKHPDHLAQRLIPSLGMPHHPLKVGGRGPAENPEIGLPEGRERGQR